jgi:Fic-DOC domain mobile mystery protein B
VTDPLQGGDDANTPLTPEERRQLIPSYITFRGELNEAEQANILEAIDWLRGPRREVVGEDFLRELHRRMFGKVWRWAGHYRTTDRNIGVAPHRIGPETRRLLGDVRYQIEHHSLPPDEIAIRFSHRLVSIHPFPNGNGRHSRLAGDLLAAQLGQPPFTWGRENLVTPGATRAVYVAALRAADAHDYDALLAFARS